MQQTIIRPSKINSVVGIGRTLAYAKLDPKSPYFDATWPRPIRLSARAIGWRLDELQAWLDAQARVGQVAA